MKICGLLAFAVVAWAGPAAECACDHADPATLTSQPCSLCSEAARQTAEPSDPFPVFFLKDASPRKPNRTLALPVRHGKGPHDLRHLSPQERTLFWKAAIAKAQELWPGVWGLAVNSDTVRTQCHLHMHIGKLNDGPDETTGQTVGSVEQFPVPELDQGIWLHPVSGGYHVHTDREIAEPVLLR